MLTNPELGYTPKNLRELRTAAGLTLAQVAEITGTKNTRSVISWELPAENGEYNSMPHKKWLLLLDFCANKQKNEK